jgi:hypothetical protein
MKITDTLGWSKFPMMHRVGDLDPSIKITFIYGEDSWMDHASAYSLKYIRHGKVDVKVRNVIQFKLFAPLKI